MRILVLQESDWIERGPHQSHHLLERMVQRGHQARVIDFEIGWRENHRIGISPRTVLRPPPKVIEGSSITVVRPAAVRLPIFEYASSFVTHAIEIRRQIKEFRPDLILGFGLLNAFVGLRQAERARIPFVYYLIDELHRLVPQRALRGLARVVEQSNVRRASLVLSINQALRDYSVDMGAQPEKAKVLPAGVDFERYLSSEGRAEIRNLHGLRRGDLVLFFMGWVYPFSGLREITQGLTRGEGRDANIKLLVVGKGDFWDELVQLAKTRGAEDRIKTVEFKPYSEMPSYLAAADICILPAHDVAPMRNIVPIKMYEYLAAAKPVIATRLAGLVKEFGEGNGVVYVNGPDEVLSRASELARQGELLKLGERGRTFVSENDWARITETVESYFDGLAHKAETRQQIPWHSSFH